MEWRTRSEFEITNLGDRLEVLVRTQRGKIEWLIVAIGAPLAVYSFLRASQILGIVVAVVAVFSLLNQIRKGNETHLIVRPDGFIAEGNIDRTFADRVSVSVADIHSIGYFAGCEDDPSGLYAFSRLGKNCLIPGLGRDSCLSVQAAIESKFPSMEFGEEPLSYPFGDGPEIITLGLNKQDSSNLKGSSR